MRPTDRLLRRGIPNTAMRKALEDWSDRLSWWERVWTAIVVLGLGFEIAVNLARFSPHTVFDLVWPHSRLLSDIGSTMVFVGVFGELVVASKSGRVETDLREENDRLIQEANSRAEEANLKRAELEASFKRRTISRNLNADEIASVVEAISKYKGQKFILQFNSPLIDGALPPSDMTSEQISFTIQLREILSSAGWEHTLDESLPDLGVKYGVTIFKPDPFIESVREEVRTNPLSPYFAGGTLYSALRKLDLICDNALGPNEEMVIVAIGLL